MVLKQGWEIGGFGFSTLRFGPISGHLFHPCRTVAEDTVPQQAKVAQLCNYSPLSRVPSDPTWGVAGSSAGPPVRPMLLI